MAYEYGPYFARGYRAAADLRTKQFFFVKFDASGDIILCAAATDIPVGVLQNTPNTGETANVMRSGVSKVSAGGAIAVGAQIGTTNGGQSVAVVAGTDTTKYVLGQADEAAAAINGLHAVAINCFNLNRAA